MLCGKLLLLLSDFVVVRIFLGKLFVVVVILMEIFWFCCVFMCGRIGDSKSGWMFWMIIYCLFFLFRKYLLFNKEKSKFMVYYICFFFVFNLNFNCFMVLLIVWIIIKSFLLNCLILCCVLIVEVGVSWDRCFFGMVF